MGAFDPSSQLVLLQTWPARHMTSIEQVETLCDLGALRSRGSAGVETERVCLRAAAGREHMLAEKTFASVACGKKVFSCMSRCRLKTKEMEKKNTNVIVDIC